MTNVAIFLGSIVFVIGVGTAYAAYRLKWVSFELSAYIMLGVFFLSLFISTVIGSQDWISGLARLAISLAILAVIIRVALKQRETKAKR